MKLRATTIILAWLFVANAGGPRAEDAVDALNDLYRKRFSATQ